MKLLFVLLLVIAVLYLLVRRGRASSQVDTPVVPNRRKVAAPTDPDDGLYAAVAIDFQHDCCVSAKALGGTRFLRNETPTLPLADCTQLNCRCRYVHYEDRRVDENDRRIPHSLQSDLYVANGERERRSESGRRDEDLVVEPGQR